MAWLFLDETLTDAAVGSVLALTGAEARHAASASRLRVGETTTIGNGRGLLASGPVLLARPDRVELRAERVEHVERAEPRTVLVQALAKGGRDEAAVQAATELGVDVIIPWQAERSIVRWTGEKRRKGTARWRSIAREAAKQSMRAWTPEVRDPMGLRELGGLAAETRMLLLDPAAELPLTGLGTRSTEAGERDIVLVVGPEGGVSDTERTRLLEAGAVAVRLGDTVLRTSTAGPAALAVVNVVPGLAGRW